MTKEELSMDLPKWWAGQPPQVFEVRYGEGKTMRVKAHEVSIGSPQPNLSFVRYEIRNVDVMKTTGGSKNKVEKEETIEHPVMVYAASFNAGAWISFRDIEHTELTGEGEELEA